MRPLATSWPPERRTALANGAAQVFSKTSSAAEVPGSSALAGLADVVVGEQPRGGALEDGQLGHVAAEVGDLEAGDGAVLALGDEGEVEDADQAAVDQVDQVRRHLAVRLAARPLDQEVIDRSHLTEVVAVQSRILSSSRELPMRCVPEYRGPSRRQHHLKRVMSPLTRRIRSAAADRRRDDWSPMNEPLSTDEAVKLYGNRFLTEDAPDGPFPASGMSALDAMRLVDEELALEGDPNRNLATFVTTWMEPEAQRLIAENLYRNFIDHAEYPISAEIEQRCIRMLADLYNAPGETTGARTQGSSEAIMLGALSLKWKWKERREADRQAGRQAEPDLRRRRARGLGEVLPLLRRRAADRAAAGGQVHDRPRGRRAA